MTPFRAIALGAGVQSTAVLLLALAGEIEADCAIFADTGWEPQAVYDHFARLELLCGFSDFPLYKVSAGRSIRDVKAFGKGSGLDAPFFLVNQDGSDGGLTRRQCTSKFKIAPIRRRIQELRDGRHVDQLFGISVDEIQRMRDSDVQYISNTYPLVDRGWSRRDCLAYLTERGIIAPRSACIGCPYHSDYEWRRLSPAEFADAVAWEKQIQAEVTRTGMLRGTPYVHRQRVPLDQVNLSTPEDRGQGTLDQWQDECEGMCGV